MIFQCLRKGCTKGYKLGNPGFTSVSVNQNKSQITGWNVGAWGIFIDDGYSECLGTKTGGKTENKLKTIEVLVKSCDDPYLDSPHVYSDKD